MNEIATYSTTKRWGSMLRMVGSFASRVVLYGFVGYYVFAIYAVVRAGHSWAPVPDFPSITLIGAISGGYMGSLAWFSRNLLNRRPKSIWRLIVAIASPALIGAGLLTIFLPSAEKTIATCYIPGTVLGLITGLISESKKNPWNLIFRGLGARQRETKTFALFGGTALRAGGLLGLLGFVWLCVGFWKLFGMPREGALAFLGPLVYLALTVLVAFSSSPRWIEIGVGALINAPLVILIVILIPKLADGSGLVVATFITYFVLWVVFIAGRQASAPLMRPVRKRALRLVEELREAAAEFEEEKR